jgi:hypothetical protein
VAKVERERLSASLRLARRLAFSLDNRPDSFEEEVSDRFGRVPDVDPFHLVVACIPNDRGNKGLRRIF